MTLTFGTDGVRGRSHDELTEPWVEALAAAAAEVLGVATMVVGHDGRESGPGFVEAVVRGCAGVGTGTWFMGMAPTPAIAHIAASHEVGGAMISASHNPFHDNGVKFFAPGGRKLTDAHQAEIENRLRTARPVTDDSRDGIIVPEPRTDLLDEWVEHLVSTVDEGFDGVHVVIDTANGAASEVATSVLRRLGAAVDVINNAPDGRNINRDCGSTYPAALQAAVVGSGADLGLAFDGDADRVLAVDHTGELIDGDHIIAIAAIDRHARGLLADDTVVITVMTNLGFRLAMAQHDITVHETPVGDRYVLEALERHGWTLGGEQSGHVIFHDLATTGDGLLTGIQLIDAVRRSGRSLHELSAAAMTRLPQVLENVRVQGAAADLVPLLAADIAAAEAELGERGRVLVRPSGTEPLLRIMVEAPTPERARATTERLMAATEALLG